MPTRVLACAGLTIVQAGAAEAPPGGGTAQETARPPSQAVRLPGAGGGVGVDAASPEDRHPLDGGGVRYAALTDDEPKAVNLRSNPAAETTNLLGLGGTAHRSIAYEEPKRRLGGWEACMGWWKGLGGNGRE